MKHAILILFLFFVSNLSAQFTVVSTKLVDEFYQNTFTAFLTPSTTSVYNDFPSIGVANTLNAQENIVDARVKNGAVVEARATVNPLVQGDEITGTVNFYAMFRDNSPENCQIRFNIVMLYEFRNDGVASADLFYALNPQIQFLKNGTFSGGSGYYRIQLNQSNSSGSIGSSIYDSGNLTASLNNALRGTAYSNVPAGET